MIAKRFSELAETHLGTRKDVIAKPLWHDTPEAMAAEHGVVKDWRLGRSSGWLRADPGQDDAGDRGRRARLHRDLREDDLDRPVAGEGRHADQGRGLRRQARGRHPPPSQRRRPRWRRGRPAEARDRRPDGRRDPAPGRRLERTPGHPGLPVPREAHRHPAARPRRRARGQADHLRRHPGRTGAGHHLPGVVRLGVRRAPLLTVHHQHRAAQALPHPHRTPAVLRRPRLVPRHGRDAPGLPAAVEHDHASSTSRRSGRRASSACRCAT